MSQSIFFRSIDGELDHELSASAGQMNSLLQDRGLAYGHGLFETMAYHEGAIPLQTQHLQRLIQSAPKLGISLDLQRISLYLQRFITQLKAQSVDNGVIKLIATAGSGGRGYQSPEMPKPRIILSLSPLPEALADPRVKGVSLWRCDYPLPNNPRLAGLKHLNRLDQVLARAEVDSAGAGEFSDGLMFGNDGHLVETTSANIVVKTVRGWVTPSLHQAGVAGVMRGMLLDELFPQVGLTLTVGTITESDLRESSEVFICNSIRGILPVKVIMSASGDLDLRFPIGSETKMLQSNLSANYVFFQ
jgi:4-amino-4-deoxychorismate lyase